MTKRRIGDRKDGRYLRDLDPYYKITPFIMRSRNDASNYFRDQIEISAASDYIRRKRREGLERLGFLHLFVAAYVRMLSQCPALNRFISGQRIYARNNIIFVMTVKKEMRAQAGETSIKVEFSPADTIKEVYERIETEVAKVKNNTEESKTDGAAKALMRLPRPILRLMVSILSLMDYFGHLPNALMDASPFHGSIIVTNMASLGIQPIYHHLYNFGNLPVFVSFGAKRRVYELTKTGDVVNREYMDFAVVTDERICDGFNYARGFKFLKSYLREPDVLDQPPETVVKDI